MLGLLGLRIFEATGSDIADIGEEHCHRVLRGCGKGTKVGPSTEPLAAGPAARSCSTPEAPGWTATPQLGDSGTSPTVQACFMGRQQSLDAEIRYDLAELPLPLSLADAAVDPFPQQVGVAAVAGGLLPHVGQQREQHDAAGRPPPAPPSERVGRVAGKPPRRAPAGPRP